MEFDKEGLCFRSGVLNVNRANGAGLVLWYKTVVRL